MGQKGHDPVVASLLRQLCFMTFMYSLIPHPNDPRCFYLYYWKSRFINNYSAILCTSSGRVKMSKPGNSNLSGLPSDRKKSRHGVRRVAERNSWWQGGCTERRRLRKEESRAEPQNTFQVPSGQAGEEDAPVTGTPHQRLEAACNLKAVCE